MTDAKLLYQSATSELWLGDSRELLPTHATESADLILTDPPYGQSWQSNQRTVKFDHLQGDGAAERGDIADVIRNCVRIVGQNRHLYVFGPSDVLEGQKVSEIVTLIWDKGTHGSGNLASPWGPAHEPISFCTSKHRHAGQTGKRTLPTRLRKGSVLRHTRPTGLQVRGPSEKPVPLLRELIESSTRAGDLVVDPYAGTGSTGVAAILSGRRAILIENDPQWAAIALERVTRADAAYADASRI